MGWAIAVHGGAGDVPVDLPPEKRDPQEATLRHCLDIGIAALKHGRPPLDVFELVIDHTQHIPKEVQAETHAASGDNSHLGTVGCLAVDGDGNLASATSTGGPGGLGINMVGRIGDTPIIGAGTYANMYCAVSATRKGETTIRGTIARDRAALMKLKGLHLKEAAAYVVEKSERGTVGLIAVSVSGEIPMPCNTTGMLCAAEDGH